MTTFQMILQPLLGSIIGFSTNWIAIKMLFRPYTEKRLFGKIKVPFTPGLIPGERKALAKKIGQVTSEHVLTDEVLTSSLNSLETNDKIDKLVRDFFTSLKENNLTIGENINLLVGETSTDYIDNINMFLKQRLEESINQENVNLISKFIVKLVVDTTKNLDQVINSENINSFLTSYLDINKLDNLKYNETKVNNIISIKYIDGLKNVVNDNIDKIILHLIQAYENNPQLNESVKILFNKVIIDNFGKLVGVFVGNEKTFNNVLENLFEYLRNPLNQEQISKSIQALIDKLANTEISTIYNCVEKASEKYDFQDYKQIIWEKVKYLLIENIEKNELGIYGIIKKIDNDFENKLKKFIAKTIINKKDEIIIFIYNYINNLISKILDVSFKNLYNKFIYNYEENLIKYINKFTKIIILKAGAIIIKNFNMEKIIEDRINEFEVDKAEKIIISVVSKELNAITWLGGLLGFVIGIVPVIIELFG